MHEDKKVCLNELCEVYGRESPVVFQETFKHCPYCGAKMTTYAHGMVMLKKDTDVARDKPK